jgi:segregation and condensation protein A
MTEEENILKIIIEKQSWEEIIYYVVNVENLDPWNIDLVKLTNGFLKFLHEAEELDFRIPAKIVFVAAILLRLKSNYLSIFEEEEPEENLEQKPMIYEEPPELLALGIPLKRVPKRQITLEELINALRKALAVKERKEARRERLKKELQARIVEEEDIEKRLEKLMMEIDKLIKELNISRIEFRRIVKKWDTKNIVYNFVPLLHLEQKEKIITEQEKWFEEIFIRKREKIESEV